jgi:urease accessory protein
MGMPTDPADLLRLTQWLSPSFPVSAYAYSHGLEAEIAAGRVTDAAAVEAWLRHILQAGAARSDAILLIAARGDGADLAGLSDLARALAGSAERLRETEDQGAAFALTLHQMGQGDGTPRPYPVAFGAASAALRLADATVAALFLQAIIGNLVAAAVRFVPLGQAEGQRIVAALHPFAITVAGQAVAQGLDGLGQAAFGADLAAMEHETQEVRIFRT